MLAFCAPRAGYKVSVLMPSANELLEVHEHRLHLTQRMLIACPLGAGNALIEPCLGLIRPPSLHQRLCRHEIPRGVIRMGGEQAIELSKGNIRLALIRMLHG